MTRITIPTFAKISKFDSPKLVACYNELITLIPEGETRPNPVKKFRTLAIGRNKVKNLAKQLAKKSKGASVRLSKAPKEVAPTPPPSPKPATDGKLGRPRRGTNIQPPETKGKFEDGPTPCLKGTKQATLLDALAVEGGSSMEELLEAMSGGKKPWSEHNIRSGFGWDMKLHGYGVRSEVVDGVERFFIVVPKGFSVVPHRERKTAKE